MNKQSSFYFLGELIKNNNLKEKSEERFYKKLNLLERQNYNTIVDKLTYDEGNEKIDLSDLKMKACSISIVKDLSLKYYEINEYVVVFDINYFDADDFKWLTYKSIYSLQGELIDDLIILLDEEVYTTKEKLTDNISLTSIKENIKSFDMWIREHNIEIKTMQCFTEVIKGWEINDLESFKEMFEDIDLDSVKPEFNFIEFYTGNILEEETAYDEVVIRSSFTGKYDGTAVFAYDVLFNEVGKIIDDALYDSKRCFY